MAIVWGAAGLGAGPRWLLESPGLAFSPGIAYVFTILADAENQIGALLEDLKRTLRDEPEPVKRAPEKSATAGQPTGLGTQADYYIVAMLPPEPDAARRDALILQILSANRYTRGTAGITFQISHSAREDSFMTMLLIAYERHSGRKIDYDRTRLHSFSSRTVNGMMAAVFYAT